MAPKKDAARKLIEQMDALTAQAKTMISGVKVIYKERITKLNTQIARLEKVRDEKVAALEKRFGIEPKTKRASSGPKTPGKPRVNWTYSKCVALKMKADEFFKMTPDEVAVESEGLTLDKSAWGEKKGTTEGMAFKRAFDAWIKKHF